MIDLPDNNRDWIKLILVMVIIITCGWVSINQYIGFRYKAELMMYPCDLCIEKNPHYEYCFDDKDMFEKNNNYKINLSEVSLLNP